MTCFFAVRCKADFSNNCLGNWVSSSCLQHLGLYQQNLTTELDKLSPYRVCRFLNLCCNFLRCTFVIGSKRSALIQIWGPPVDPSSSVTPTRSVLNSDPNKYKRSLRSNLFFSPKYYSLVVIYGTSLIYLLYLRLAKIWQLASDWQFGVLWSTQNGRIKLIHQEEIC